MKHSIDVRVYYEDTDAGGIVYHSNYLNFAERGRTELLRHMGFESGKFQSDFGMMFVTAHLDINFENTAYLDDLLQIETTVAEIKNSSFILRQHTVRDGETIADMRVVLVCVDLQEHRPVRLPKNVKEAFQPYLEALV